MNPYHQISFLKSVAALQQLPSDEGIEVAFAGRSNAGKSSALNFLTGIKKLARTSKNPGCTQFINVFPLDDTRRLIDLPGYGYAKVPQTVKAVWQKNLSKYLETRESLKGLVVLMDCRHPLKELDKHLINWAIERQLPLHVLLTKSDKLSKSAVMQTCRHVREAISQTCDTVQVQPFSTHQKQGLEELIARLNTWFEWE